MSAAGVPVFLTAQQVADMLQVDERTILRWAQHDASMPATRLGRVVRFELAEVTGEPSGTRTRDPLIKSQVLFRLS